MPLRTLFAEGLATGELIVRLSGAELSQRGDRARIRHLALVLSAGQFSHVLYLNATVQQLTSKSWAPAHERNLPGLVRLDAGE
jgi:hypothetical protein